MHNRTTRWLLLAAGSLLVGCASTDATVIETSEDRVIPRPDRILVYDVAASEEDAAGNPSIEGRYSRREDPLTEDQIAVGRELGAAIAEQIVESLRELGLPAERATGTGVVPRMGDVLVRGEFIDIDEGSRVTRMLIGFGAGASELTTHFFTYVVTERGPEPVGEAEIETEGGKMPGMLLSMGVGGLAQGAAVGGAAATAKEFGPESMGAAAERTAEKFMELVKPGLVRRGWITEEVAD